MAAIPLLTALGRIYKLNYRQLNAVSLTLTASRFQNIFLRHAYAGSDELLHYTPPISPYPPLHPQPLILNSPIRTTGGCHTDTHREAGEQLYSAASQRYIREGFYLELQCDSNSELREGG